jgi:hypothetical protein
MVRILSILLAISIQLSACRADSFSPSETLTPVQPSPTPGVPVTIIDGGIITIFVDSSITHQIVKDVTGGNFINVFSSTKDPLEPVSIYNLQNLDVRVARIRMTLEEWEPANDDDDPHHFNWDAFQYTDFNHASFQLMWVLMSASLLSKW